ncbi:MAG: HD domain-containing protein [Candidatus Omnitrophica bacterium]|nr:HD domain-containing protein [Candidatus Omnitrophota bacterium]
MQGERLDYRKELEKAAKQMILIHRVDTLVKIILRTTIRILRIEHASLLLFDESRNAYVAYSSRGKTGIKIPKGLTRISCLNPLIRYFTDWRSQVPETDYLLLSQIKDSLGSFSEELKEQFLLHNIKACIPGFFRKKLIFVLFLGEKLVGQDFTAEELGFMSILSSDIVMAIQNASLFQDLDEQLLKNKNLFLQTVFALSSAIEAKDLYTQGHTERVTHYSLTVATELKEMDKIDGLDTKRLFENLRISSLLHDIGKIGIPEAILNKKDDLTEEEREQMKKHSLIGARILSEVDEFYEPILGVKYHHERYDGTGYPDGLKGEEIPLIARIIAIADTFDAMTTHRPYRASIPKEEAISIIHKESGRQFDPVIAEAFLSACEKGGI